MSEGETLSQVLKSHGLEHHPRDNSKFQGRKVTRDGVTVFEGLWWECWEWLDTEGLHPLSDLMKKEKKRRRQ